MQIRFPRTFASRPGLPGLTIVAGGAALILSGCGGFFAVPGDIGTGTGTQFSQASGSPCEVSFYDSEFEFGFNLPADAQWSRSDTEQDSLTNSLWTLTRDGALINVVARVQSSAGDAELGDIVRAANDLALSLGGDLLMEEAVELPDGGEGLESVVRFYGLTTFRVQALRGGRLFTVEATIEDKAQTDVLDAMLSEMVLSLCID